MMVEVQPPVEWMTLLSWMEVRAPTRMDMTSPRNTTPNQMLAFAPTTTSPINAAVGAMKLEGSTPGRMPRYGVAMAWPPAASAAAATSWSRPPSGPAASARTPGFDMAAVQSFAGRVRSMAGTRTLATV